MFNSLSTGVRKPLLALLICTAIALAACGGGESSDTTAEPGTTTAGPTTTAAEPGTTAASTPATTVASGDCATPSGDPVIIGGAMAETGFVTAWDTAAIIMMNWAIDDVNCAGGIEDRPLELIVENTESDVNRAANAALSAIDQGAEVIVASPDFTWSQGAAQVANENGFLNVLSCGSIKCGIEGDGPLTFNVGFGALSEGATLAEFSEASGWATAYVLTDASIDYTIDVCRGFSESFSELVGADAIVGEDTFQNDDANIASQISRINSLATPPDALMICSYNPGAASAIRQIRSSGYEGVILSPSSMDGTYWLEAVPDLSDFYIVTYAATESGLDPRPKVNELLDRYVAEEGEPPGNPSAALSQYTGIEVIAEALSRAGGSTVGTDLQAALESEPIATILDEIEYSSEIHMDLFRPFAVMRYQGGTVEFVEMREPESVPE